MAKAPTARDRLLSRLHTVGAMLADAETQTSKLYRKRLALLQQARDLDPPVPTTQLAEAAGMSPNSVRQALHKARKAADT